MSYGEAVLAVSIQHLEIFGKGYVIEHCVAFFQRQQKEEEYRVYVTDTLKAMAESIAHAYGGSVPKYRYADIIQPGKPEVEETRTAQEIISNISKKLNRMTGD